MDDPDRQVPTSNSQLPNATIGAFWVKVTTIACRSDFTSKVEPALIGHWELEVDVELSLSSLEQSLQRRIIHLAGVTSVNGNPADDPDVVEASPREPPPDHLEIR